MQFHPYQGTYKPFKVKSVASEEIDEYEIMALCKRLNITIDDMKEMSFVSLINILISSVDDEDKPRQATQEDIDRFIGA